jgi:hypothetical protein
MEFRKHNIVCKLNSKSRRACNKFALELPTVTPPQLLAWARNAPIGRATSCTCFAPPSTLRIPTVSHHLVHPNISTPLESRKQPHTRHETESDSSTPSEGRGEYGKVPPESGLARMQMRLVHHVRTLSLLRVTLFAWKQRLRTRITRQRTHQTGVSHSTPTSTQSTSHRSPIESADH